MERFALRRLTLDGQREWEPTLRKIRGAGLIRCDCVADYQHGRSAKTLQFCMLYSFGQQGEGLNQFYLVRPPVTALELCLL